MAYNKHISECSSIVYLVYIVYNCSVIVQFINAFSIIIRRDNKMVSLASFAVGSSGRRNTSELTLGLLVYWVGQVQLV